MTIYTKCILCNIDISKNKKYCINCYRQALSKRNSENNHVRNHTVKEQNMLKYNSVLKKIEYEYISDKKTTIRDLAKKHDVPFSRVRKYLSDSNLTSNRESKNNNFHEKVDSRLLTFDYLKQCVDKKYTLKYVATELNVAPNTIRIYALKYGLIFPGSTTTAELEISDFVNSIGIDCELHNRQVLKPFEIDIYIPEYKFGIEYNGLYWHSNTTDHKHISKQILAEKNGIDLIQIFEHEWLNDREKVESIIRSRLNVNTKIYARKCEIVEVTRDECNDFMKLNHLQSECNHGIAYGLKYKDKLVTCISFSRPRFNKKYDYELIRFANALNISVIGGFSRLLKHFKSSQLGSIITYSHRRLFSGKVYQKFGFNLIHETSPGYFWYKNKTIVSRYKTQKHKLSKLLPSSYSYLLTEEQNMVNAGYTKVYDCGQRVFLLK